ncbi:hypothetical protein KFK09_004889 [Dendrobium nobile]|uniref:Uncharacterized protein n=1 Tax=Dendrobium nobile TaxID=94219 RepID=A0A8T3BU74_DENNO|nr:hypothetical protein KFK09_004889 [Dendrobium nobile]
MEQIKNMMETHLEVERREQLLHDIGKQVMEGSDEDEETQEARIMTEYIKESVEKPTKKVLNCLFNIVIFFEIPGVPTFSLRAMVDTSATSCYVNTRDVPEAAREELSYQVSFNGVNLISQSQIQVKNGTMIIGENKFRIPLIYCFDMST